MSTDSFNLFSINCKFTQLRIDKYIKIQFEVSILINILFKYNNL